MSDRPEEKKKEKQGGGRPQNTYKYLPEEIVNEVHQKLDHVLGLLEHKQVRSDAFRTKLVRIIMKIPLFICQSKNPPVIRTALYKSKNILEYRDAFKRAFNILK